MAGGSQNPKGTDPWVASPRTGGPLGTNKDAADSDTPGWFLGDTPGSLGYNDHADPLVRRLVQVQIPDQSALPSQSPSSPKKCDSDCRFGAPARMMLGSVWVVMDEQAWEIFDLWFNGKAPSDVTFDSAKWASYMGAAETLRQQINDHLTAHAEGIGYRVDRGPGPLQENFRLTFHAEVGTKYGGYATGYQVLHGSNRTVGDFQITGRFTAVRPGPDGTGYAVTYDRLVFVFNDIVDINKQYSRDISLGQAAAKMARCLDTGPPKDYILHIKWAAPEPVSIEISPTLQTKVIRNQSTPSN